MKSSVLIMRDAVIHETFNVNRRRLGSQTYHKQAEHDNRMTPTLLFDLIYHLLKPFCVDRAFAISEFNSIKLSPLSNFDIL